MNFSPFPIPRLPCTRMHPWPRGWSSNRRDHRMNCDHRMYILQVTSKMCWLKPWWKKNIAHSWKKCIIVIRKCRLSGVWRTIMFISQLQDWFDLIIFLIRFQLKEVCEYASNWYQVYIYTYIYYIYTKCRADLSFPKSVKDSRHIDETRVQHEQFLWIFNTSTATTGFF